MADTLSVLKYYLYYKYKKAVFRQKRPGTVAGTKNQEASGVCGGAFPALQGNEKTVLLSGYRQEVYDGTF